MKEEKKLEKTNPFAGRKYIRAIGRRKSAVAAVKIYSKGKGVFIVNKKDINKYFFYPDFAELAMAPAEKSGKMSVIDANMKVSGGGGKSQAEAIRLALARGLVSINDNLRKNFRKQGFLTIDARVKERKKPGLKRARRSPQWSKR